jgi:hypothetical protein
MVGRAACSKQVSVQPLQFSPSWHFSACLVAVNLLPLGFVNCNLKQQVCASTCGLKKKEQRELL